MLDQHDLACCYLAAKKSETGAHIGGPHILCGKSGDIGPEQSERRKGFVLIRGSVSMNSFRGVRGSSKYWNLKYLKGGCFQIFISWFSWFLWLSWLLVREKKRTTPRNFEGGIPHPSERFNVCRQWWHPDRHANATSPPVLRDDQTLCNHCVTVQWRCAGCRVSPYRHPGWHANVVPAPVKKVPDNPLPTRPPSSTPKRRQVGPFRALVRALSPSCRYPLRSSRGWSGPISPHLTAAGHGQGQTSVC